MPLKPPAPKIMILGQKGAGVSTQIDLLCKKYKLDSINLKDEFLDAMERAKVARKRQRKLVHGWQQPGDPDPEPDGDRPPNPLIENDPESFDREAAEKDFIKEIFKDSSRGLIIDGTWNNFAEDQVLATDGGPFINLLLEARRPPEMVVVLKCSDESAKKRMIDWDAIQAKFDEDTEIRH